MKNLKIKLFFCLVIFTILIVTVITYVNRQILIDDIEGERTQSERLIEDHILNDMKSVDTAHYYLDSEISNSMKNQLEEMVDYYRSNPSVLEWNLTKMKKSHGFDIYILDQSNTVIHTTFQKDLGLNFSQCCTKFASLLDKRRESGEFYSDGIDVSIETGQLKKYSYLGTPDNKYLFELSINLSDLSFFEDFNFVSTSNYLVNKYEDLLQVRILNAGGYFLNDASNIKLELSVEDMSKEFQAAFNEAKATMKPVEYAVSKEDGIVEMYRFLPYEAPYERGDSTTRVVFMKYDNGTELKMLKENNRQYLLLLTYALVLAVVMLIILNYILSSTLNLAKYDHLTGVYNRASYTTYMKTILGKKRNKRVGLLLIDLDNFKKINDQFGHSMGDEILMKAGKIFEKALGKKKGIVARLGGDEFAIVIAEGSKEKLTKIAEDVLIKYHELQNEFDEKAIRDILSLSIGGTIASQKECPAELFKRADEALYMAKEAGKNQFLIL